MKFFFDRCVPIALARMVAILEQKFHVIGHHDDDGRFDEFTADTEWMKVVGSDDPKPIVVSGDGKILKNPEEINTLREQRLAFFLLGEDFEEMQYQLQAWKFLKCWPDIVKESAKMKEPSVFRIRTGSSQKVEFVGLTKNLPRK